MKTLLTFALVFAGIAGAQTVSISITGVSPAVIADIRTHWLDQTGASAGTIGAAIDASTTSVTVAISQASLSAAQPLPVAGQSVLIDGEPMVTASVSGTNVTFTRGTLPMATLQAHAAGASISILKYSDPWQMLVTEAIRPWVQGVISSLGARSMALGASVTGTVQP